MSNFTKITLGLISIVGLILSACTPLQVPPTPTNTPLPTNTSAPTSTLMSTSTITPAFTPTETPAPSDTPEPTVTTLPTQTATVTPTFAPATVVFTPDAPTVTPVPPVVGGEGCDEIEGTAGFAYAVKALGGRPVECVRFGGSGLGYALPDGRCALDVPPGQGVNVVSSYQVYKAGVGLRQVDVLDNGQTCDAT